MRIAFLSAVYPPMVSGASLVIERLAEGLAARGHQVLVLTASDRPRPYQSGHDGLQINRLKSYRNPFRVGQRLVLWPERSILRALNEFQPDLLHITDPLQYALPGLKYARRHAIPGIYTVQALPWFVSAYLPDVSWLRRWFESLLWSYARFLMHGFCATVTPTHTTARIVNANTGIQADVISSGVDLDIFKPDPNLAGCNKALRQSLGIPCDAPVILHVGRLDIEKQIQQVVSCCAPVIKETGAHLLVVGDGKQRSHLEQQCEQLGIADHSHFTGFVSIEDGLVDLYRLASVFVMACQIETQGIVLLEAAACAVPIIAVDATAISEIVHHGENGFLVPPDSPEEMGPYVRRLVQDADLARRMGRVGRSIVQDHATQCTVDQYEAVFVRCLKASGR